MKLRNACNRYGADFGRPQFLPDNPEQTPLNLRVWRMALDDGGYDQGDAYWGTRKPKQHIYWAESVESVALAAPVVPNHGTVEMHCDAYSFEEAWQNFVKRCPKAVLCPTQWVTRSAKVLLKRLWKKGVIAPAGRPIAECGRNWPYINLGWNVQPDAEVPVALNGYARIFRVHPVSTIDPTMHLVQEKIYQTL